MKRRLADICLRSVVKMVLLDNFLHGDLHPGNIFVVCGDDDPQVGSGGRPGGKAMNLDDLRVVLLDAGLAVGLDDQQHRQLVSILEAFTKNDGRKAAQLAVEASKKKEGKDDGQGASVYEEAQDLEAFLDGCDAVVREAKMSQNLTRTLSKHISDMFALAAKHNVRLESFFVSTAIPVRVMEGIGARLSPDVEVGPSRISLRTPCCCLILTCLYSYFLRFVDASLHVIKGRRKLNLWNVELHVDLKKRTLNIQKRARATPFGHTFFNGIQTVLRAI